MSNEKSVYKELTPYHPNLNQRDREAVLLQDDGSYDSS